MFQVIRRNISDLKMPLKFAANISMMFPEVSNLLDRYGAAKQAGFEAVEVAWPYDFPVDEVVAAKEKHQMHQVLLNTYGGNKPGDIGLAALPDRHDEFKESLERSIKYCKALKCPRLHIMTGRIPECSEQDRTALVAKMEKTFVENLKHAADRLKQENILGLIEPLNTKVSVPGYFLDNQYKAVEFIQRVGSDNIKLQMDLFHVQVMHGNISNIMKELWPYVGHIQFAQCPSRHEPSFEGELNFDYIFSYIESLGYDGWVGAEYKPSDSSKETFKWLQRYK
ncbi:putative hydroxypyruvate isomerase [Amphiura filiformis]|uniref:putative hydroxypyruvate isomerase n=1 Tax=Amphiura filiformis TaxID=82378 RepID=UPI003B213BB0